MAISNINNNFSSNLKTKEKPVYADKQNEKLNKFIKIDEKIIEKPKTDNITIAEQGDEQQGYNYGDIKSGRISRVEMSAEQVTEQLSQQIESAEAIGDGLDVFIKCMKIALRIICGDNVPEKDNKYLSDNNPELHFKAWSLRIYKEEPEDCDSVLGDEDSEKSGDGLDISCITNTENQPVIIE